MTIRRYLALAALLSSPVLQGCAQHIANQSAKGMASALQEQQAETDPNKQPSRLMGERAAIGAVTALDQPEQRDRIRRMVDESVRQAVAAAFTAAITPPEVSSEDGAVQAASPAEMLAAQLARTATASAVHEIEAALGPHGVLTASLVDTGARVSASVVAGATSQLGELFPGCSGADAQACRERRLQELTRAAGAGFSMGVRDALGWPIAVMAALAGILIGVIGHRAWTARRSRLRLRTA
jgi:hypothetical protein